MQELTVWPKEKRLRNNVSNDLHCEIKKKKGKSNIIDLTLAPSLQPFVVPDTSQLFPPPAFPPLSSPARTSRARAREAELS
jgi:hypothetical protein